MDRATLIWLKRLQSHNLQPRIPSQILEHSGLDGWAPIGRLNTEQEVRDVLKSIQIKGFKSYPDSGRIDLKPINLLAGANSSGKSSLIQSILLIKQTLQYGADNRPIVLNGPLLRLGSLEDIKSSKTDTNHFEVALEFTVEKSDGFQTPVWQKTASASIGATSATLKAFRVAITIGSGEESIFDSAPRRLSGSLLETTITYEIEDKEGRSKQLKCILWPKDGEQFGEVRIDLDELQSLESRYPSARIVQAYVEKFMPSFFQIEFNKSPKEAEGIADFLTSTSFFSSTHEKQDDLISPAVCNVLNQWAVANEKRLPENVSSMTLQQAKDAIRNLLPPDFGFLIATTRGKKSEQERASLRDMIRAALIDELPENRAIDYIHIDYIRAIYRILQAYFKEGVRYLGPLREPPKPVYQPEALESFTEVGYRGEHTASVIEINKATRVYYFDPPSSGGDGASGGMRYGTLLEALRGWIRYLGVAQDVETTDAGVYGNRLQVATEVEGQMHDLTNVGVGVSQVLPILVSTLLAQKDSLLIFEQPELHLHPKVQSRLADFLISAARLGKQVLLETHSEYLVDRLRLRIAEDDVGLTHSLINILFLQQSGGVTDIQRIAVTEYGVVQNWPADFFDQGEKDSAEIILAAQRKRKKRIEEGGR